MSYQSASGSMADGHLKQEPKPLPITDYGKLTTPVPEVIHVPPNYIIINNVGTYKFAYGLTGSIGATVPCTNSDFNALYITGSVMAADQGNLRLNVSPSAWQQVGAGVTGSIGGVTFVYEGGS